MAGFPLGAQIRRQVFGEPKNLPDYLPKPVTSVIQFRPASADPKEVSVNWKKPPGLPPKTSYFGDPIPPLKRRSEGVSAN
jgi:hypothetical protein